MKSRIFWRTLLLAMLAFFGWSSICSTAAAQTADRYVGQWRVSTYQGFNHWNDEKCQSVAYQERLYNLAKDRDGHLSGTYASSTNVRYIRNEGGVCKLDSQTAPGPLANRTVLWVLDVALANDGALKIAATYSGCSQILMDCNAANVSKAPFTTTLHLRADGTLSDTVVNAASDGQLVSLDLVFYPDDGEQVRWRAAESALDGIWSDLLSMDAAQFSRAHYFQNDIMSSSAGFDQFMGQFRNQQIIVKHLTGHARLETRIMDYSQRIENGKIVINPEKFALIIRRVDVDDGSARVENAFLSWVDGAWRVTAWSF